MMEENKDSEIKKAEEHAGWYSELIKGIVYKVYKDAFVHGYKHGWNDYKVEHNKPPKQEGR
jgi:hypothetical protein